MQMSEVSDDEVNRMREKLSVYGQEHLLTFIDELRFGAEPHKARQLLQDCEQIELAELTENYKRISALLGQPEEITLISDVKETVLLEPVPAELKGSYKKASESGELASLERIGLEAIARNQVAALLLAGGQGTRLGVSYPKGMCSVGLHSNKTLYQLQAERLLRLKHLAAAADAASVALELEDTTTKAQAIKDIPWYIMTSEATKETTEEFFSQNNHFGLDVESVQIFEQFMLPCLTRAGKCILDEKWRVSKAPDGNGGLFKALARRGVLADMAKRGIKYVHVYGVDNILVKLADPAFLGFCVSKGANCAAKVVLKTDPEEKVGVICQVLSNQQSGAGGDHFFQVVEYSEISRERRTRRDPATGELAYSAGNICNHFFSREFLELVSSEQNEPGLLKLHIAEKKIPYVDKKSGQRVQPKQSNGIKLEKFVFDVFPFST